MQAEKLFDYVRAAWSAENTEGSQPLRFDLQNLGDRLRSENQPGYLTEMACEHAGATGESIDLLVIDGIRNLGEIEWLRQKFGYRFYLFAVNEAWEIRWERSKKRYEEDDRTIEDFTLDDSRDQDEEVAYGQQVQLCVDEADVILANNDQLRPATMAARLGAEVGPLVRLVAGLERRYPTPEENLMNLAYGASNTSFCLKRQVGAVIVSPEDEEPISLGYNENPHGEKPCIHAYGECFRDMVRNDFFTEAHASKLKCPSCGMALGLLDDGPPWKCSGCDADVEKVFFQDRAMSVCTAIHAEARAINNARSQNLQGSTLYTTTFPCFLCAEKIINAGISKVVSAEP